MDYVTSADGTKIAYERSGSGPPLLLVHGSLNDRNVWAFTRPAFAAQFTVYAMDRRGRGGSDPPAEHALEREFEDVLAVMDAIGEPVHLVGHSFGGHCALGAAAMAPERVKKLVLYEPPDNERALDIVPVFETLAASDAIEAFMRVVEIPPDQLEPMKSTPYWAYVTSFASGMAIEARALGHYRFDPAVSAVLTMPALFLMGSESAKWLGDVMRQLIPHMPHARWITLEGQGHGAVLQAPQLFSDTVIAFLTDRH